MSSAANPRIHRRTTAAEILQSVPHLDAYCGGIGTSGTMTGVGEIRWASATATVTCRWDEEGNPSIDFLPVILARDIMIPEETNVRIPISRKKLSSGQEVVLLHLGRIVYQPVEKGNKKKAADPENKA